MVLPAIQTSNCHGPVRIELSHIVPGDDAKGLAPYYHFQVFDPLNVVVGHINFRIGETPHVMLSAGHIGYGILPEHRGRSYSYHACLALIPMIRQHYESVILTVDQGHIASERIIIKLGAEFLGESVVPEGDPAYTSERRVKRRYRWNVGKNQ